MLSRRRVPGLGGGLATGLSLPFAPARAHNVVEQPTQSPTLQKFVDALPLLRPQRPQARFRAARSTTSRSRRSASGCIAICRRRCYGVMRVNFPGRRFDVRRGQRIFVRWRNELRTPSFCSRTHSTGTCTELTRASRQPRPWRICTAQWWRLTATAVPMPGSPPDSGSAAPNGRERSTNIPINKTPACCGTTTTPSARPASTSMRARRRLHHSRRREDALGLPSGDYEVPLIIQDRSFDASGSLTYPVSAFAGSPDHPGPWVPEFFGDTIVVNGMVWPYFESSRGDIACAFSTARMPASSACACRTDGCSCRWAPTRAFSRAGLARRLLLAPGERADVIVDFRGARAAPIRLINDAPAPYPGGNAPDRRTVANVMEFRVTRPLARPDNAAIPSKLRALAPLSEQGAAVRHMALREYKDANGEPITVLLNGRRWDAPITVRPRLGATEVWHVINTTTMRTRSTCTSCASRCSTGSRST